MRSIAGGSPCADAVVKGDQLPSPDAAGVLADTPGGPGDDYGCCVQVDSSPPD